MNRNFFASLLLPLMLAAASAHGQTVLAIGNGNDSAYQSFVTGYGYSWTFVQNGTGSGQIGGDLDGIFTGSTTRRDYIQSFDYVIILRSSNSGEFTFNSDWLEINKPILVHNPNVARGSRLGLWSGDGGSFGITVTPAGDESTVVNSSYLLTGVNTSGGDANLISASTSDGIINTTTFGGANLITSVTNGSQTYYNLLSWNAGQFGFSGTSAASTAFGGHRVFFGGTPSNFSDLSGDGQLVVQNFLGIPEPSTYLMFGLGLAGLVGLRRLAKRSRS